VNCALTNYLQVHRSYLVAVDVIEKVLKHVGSQYELMIDGGNTIPLGRSYYSAVKEVLERT
ncbi:MAG: DNA-binding LytR/AlgR family response regulator, partial [Paraglaciecola sp.]